MELFKKQLEKIPGLGFVVGILAFLFVPKESTALTLALLMLSWMLYSFGHYLDGWIFDSLYRPARQRQDERSKGAKPTLTRWERITQHCPGKRKLEKNRDDAANKLACSVSGLYVRAAAGFQKSEDWENNVRLWLETSKAARTFAMPVAIALIYTCLRDLLQGGKIAMLAGHGFQRAAALVPSSLRGELEHALARLQWLLQPYVALALLCVVLFIYIYCRLRHMNALYSLVATSQLSQLVITEKPTHATLTFRDKEGPGKILQLTGLEQCDSKVTLDLWWGDGRRLIGARADLR